jgi:hypothetical protein
MAIHVAGGKPGCSQPRAGGALQGAVAEYPARGIKPGSVADAWADEVETLMPGGRPFDGFVKYGNGSRQPA